MIISKTPYRVSFFGGGTDFEKYFSQYGGQVIGSTIDKYCYLTMRNLPPFFKHKSRIVWSKIELVNSFKHIFHPTVKSILSVKKYDLPNSLEIHHQGDLPANSGIGSSSAFTVGLLNAIYNYNKKIISKDKLANQAINIEVNRMKENVGFQDQVWAAWGGLNIIKFSKNKKILVKKVKISKKKKELLQKNLIMFFIGKHRFSGKIEKNKISSISEKINTYHLIKEQVDECKSILEGKKDLNNFGYLLDDYWNLKKTLASNVTNDQINEFYKDAKKNGAIGGKLIGSGGGGFILLYSENIERLKERYNKYVPVTLKFESEGSKIIYSDSFKNTE